MVLVSYQLGNKCVWIWIKCLNFGVENTFIWTANHRDYSNIHMLLLFTPILISSYMFKYPCPLNSLITDGLPLESRDVACLECRMRCVLLYSGFCCHYIIIHWPTSPCVHPKYLGLNVSSIGTLGSRSYL